MEAGNCARTEQHGARLKQEVQSHWEVNGGVANMTPEAVAHALKREKIQRLVADEPETWSIEEYLKTVTGEKALNIGVGLNAYGKRVGIVIPTKDLNKHIHVIGGQGSGKTNLLAVMAIESAMMGLTTIVVDPHGGLVEEVYKRLPPDIEAIIAGFGYEGLRLFPYADIDLIRERAKYPTETPEREERFRAISALADGFREHYEGQGASAGSWGVNVDLIAKHAFLTLSLYPKGKLEDVIKIVVNENFRARILDEASNIPELAEEANSLRDFWNGEFKNLIENQNNKMSILAFINKIKPLIYTPEQRRFLNGHIRMADIFLSKEPKVLLIRLPEGDEWTRLVGSLLFASFYMGAFWRSHRWQGLPLVHLIIDEVSTFRSSIGILADLITKVRKFGVGVTLAHQNFSQFGNKASEFANIITAETNVTIALNLASDHDIKFLSGRVGESEAELFLGRQPTGWFTLLTRNFPPLRGKAYYAPEHFQEHRAYPAPFYKTMSLNLEAFGAKALYPGIPEEVGYPGGCVEKVETGIPETPFLCIRPEMEDEWQMLQQMLESYSAGHHLPRMVLAVAQSGMWGQNGPWWLNRWKPGLVAVIPGHTERPPQNACPILLRNTTRMGAYEIIVPLKISTQEDLELLETPIAFMLGQKPKTGSKYVAFIFNPHGTISTINLYLGTGTKVIFYLRLDKPEIGQQLYQKFPGIEKMQIVKLTGQVK